MKLPPTTFIMDNLDSNIPEVTCSRHFSPNPVGGVNAALVESSNSVLSTQAASLFWCFVGFDLTNSKCQCLNV